jgi:hypothetical protein
MIYIASSWYPPAVDPWAGHPLLLISYAVW